MGFNSLRSSAAVVLGLASSAFSSCTSETPLTCSNTISANVSAEIHKALTTMRDVTKSPQAHVNRGNFLLDSGKYFGDTNAIISGDSFVACEKNKDGEAGSCWTGTLGDPGQGFTHVVGGGSVSFDAHGVSYCPPLESSVRWIRTDEGASCKAFDGKAQSDQCAEDCANEFSASRDAIRQQLLAF